MKSAVLVGAIFIALISCAQARAPLFSGDTLPLLAGATKGRALAINNASHAVGINYFLGPRLSEVDHAVFWNEEGVATDLAPGSSFAGANAINDNDEVVGYMNGQAAVFETTGPRMLPNLPGDNHSFAQGVDIHGNVVGVSMSPNTELHGVVWLGGRGPALFLGKNVWPRAINDSGLVVGFTLNQIQELPVAFLNFKEMINLPVLPGGNFGEARAVNNGGEIVGISSAGSGFHAVKWSPNANMTVFTIADLGTIDSDEAEATAINAAGFSVGFITAPTTSFTYPVLFDPIGTLEELPMVSPGASFTFAFGINRNFEIVGSQGGNFPEVPTIWRRVPPILPCPRGGTTCQ